MMEEKRTTNAGAIFASIISSSVRTIIGWNSLNKELSTPFNKVQRKWIAERLGVSEEVVTDTAICEVLDRAREEIEGSNLDSEKSESAQDIFDKSPELWRKSVQQELRRLAS